MGGGGEESAFESGVRERCSSRLGVRGLVFQQLLRDVMANCGKVIRTASGRIDF
jgi:hypothetical protein